MLRLWEAPHQKLLAEWLSHTNTIVGFNLGFDIPLLRFRFPHLRRILNKHTHILLDASWTAYLHNEMRPERSLKNLGPITRRYSYADDLTRERAHKNATLPGPQTYVGEDTHNSMLCAAEFARRILVEFPSSPKLSPYCIRFYSDCLWTCIRMSESGVPFSLSRLQRLHRRLLKLADAAHAQCLAAGLQLSGEGSSTPSNPASKPAFLTRLIQEIDSCPSTPSSSGPSSSSSSASPPDGLPTLSTSNHPTALSRSVLDHPLLGFTEKKRDVQFSDSNRSLFRSLLPKDHPTQRVLHAIDIHSRCQKLLSDYTFPLHIHNRTAKKGIHLRTSVCTPQPPLAGSDPDVVLNHPSWYIVPSSQKDGSGGEGGTLQGRITCKNFKHQTTPPLIRKCWKSRWVGGLLVGMDLSQIELRVAALLSGDASLMGAYTRNEDLHGRRAESIWTRIELLRRYPELASHPVDKWKEVMPSFDKKERQAAKHVNFGDLFRAGPDTLQETILRLSGELYPLEMFERIFNERARVRPGLWAWQESLLDEARKTHRLELAFTGQSRWFLPKAKDGRGTTLPENEVVNFPVQTWAGNVLRRIQDRLNETLPDDDSTWVHMFLQVYDAIKFDLRSPSDLPALRAAVDEAVTHVAINDCWGMLQSHVGRTVPLKYDLKVGA